MRIIVKEKCPFCHKLRDFEVEITNESNEFLTKCHECDTFFHLHVYAKNIDIVKIDTWSTDH